MSQMTYGPLFSREMYWRGSETTLHFHLFVLYSTTLESW